MVKYLFIIALLLSQIGCANITKQLDNRVVCTASNDTAYVVSLWGAFGISTTLNAEDAKKLCTVKQTP